MAERSKAEKDLKRSSSLAVCNPQHVPEHGTQSHFVQLAPALGRPLLWSPSCLQSLVLEPQSQLQSAQAFQQLRGGCRLGFLSSFSFPHSLSSIETD